MDGPSRSAGFVGVVRGNRLMNSSRTSRHTVSPVLVAPGIVDTTMHKVEPKDALKTLQPLQKIASQKTLRMRFSTCQKGGRKELLQVDGGVLAGR